MVEEYVLMIKSEAPLGAKHAYKSRLLRSLVLPTGRLKSQLFFLSGT
jgi:hypothetical protein